MTAITSFREPDRVIQGSRVTRGDCYTATSENGSPTVLLTKQDGWPFAPETIHISPEDLRTVAQVLLAHADALEADND